MKTNSNNIKSTALVIAKITTFMLLVLLILTPSMPLQAQGEIEEEDVWQLIAAGEREAAWNLLEDKEIATNYDLRFARALLLSWEGETDEALAELNYLRAQVPERRDIAEQLIRVLGWQGEFRQAEEVARELLAEREEASLYALLAVHSQWQDNWQQAVSYWQQAKKLAESSEEEKEYQLALETATERMKARGKLDFRLARDTGNFTGELGFNVSQWQNPGVSATLGLRGIKDVELQSWEFNIGTTISEPALPEDIRLTSRLDFRPQKARQLALRQGLGWQATASQSLGLEFTTELAGEPAISSLRTSYYHRVEPLLFTAGFTSRYDEGGLEANFSRHFHVRWLREEWQPELAINHYGGDEYLVKLSLDLLVTETPEKPFNFADTSLFIFSDDHFGIEGIIY